MATLQKKKCRGHEYWYIVQSKRINGKPRPIVLAYLGKAENLLEKLKRIEERGKEALKKLKSSSHGATLALWNISIELKLEEILNRCLPPQKRDGLKVGRTLLLASIYRALHVSSKRSFSSWSKRTTLPELANFKPDKLTSQHFWDQMDVVTEEMIEKIERDLTVTLINKYHISLDTLFYDTTNFFTFIDTANEKSSLTQRGHNKQKRNDLRQFSLALLVTREFFLPLSSKVYEGNINDSKLFKEYLPSLLKRFKEINLELSDLTIVFDRGNNSKEAFREIEAGKIHYVASLSPSHHKDLLSIPTDSYSKVNVNGKEILALRTEKEIWGKKRTVVLYKSEKLFSGQLRGLERSLKNRLGELKGLKEDLARKGFTEKSWKGKKGQIEKRIHNLLKGGWGEELITFRLRRGRNGNALLSYELNQNFYSFLINNYLGKRVLITDQKDWKTEEIIATYHGESKIEQVFKHLKNPYHNSVDPTFHWTDQKIKVHTFSCLIGFLLTQLLHKRIMNEGVNLGIDEILMRLKEIRKGKIVYLTGVEEYLEEMDGETKRLYEIITKLGVEIPQAGKDKKKNS